MRILERYVFGSFLIIFIVCSILLYFTYVIGDIFGFLDEILRENIGVKSLYGFYLNMFPFIFTQVAPISCLLSCVFLLGNLNRHNEITAMKASGISLIKILKPMLVGACVIGALIFFMSDKLVPNSMRMANQIRYKELEAGKRGPSKKIKNVALYGKGNKIIFVRKFDIEKNVLHEAIIHAHDNNQKLLYKVSAKTVTWKKNKWIGREVVIYYINSEGEFMGTPEIYEENEIDLQETPIDFVNNQWQPQFMSFTQLKNYLDVFLAGSRLAHRRFSVDLHHKLAFPFACLIMILMAAPFTLTTSRGGAMLGMAKGIVIALSYIPMVAIGLGLGKGGYLHPALAAWFANIILGITGLVLTLRQ